MSFLHVLRQEGRHFLIKGNKTADKTTHVNVLHDFYQPPPSSKSRGEFYPENTLPVEMLGDLTRATYHRNMGGGGTHPPTHMQPDASDPPGPHTAPATPVPCTRAS